jgi:hypothetical protein
MQKEVKIGLEYEGVILKNGVITRFSEMPQNHQDDIKKHYTNPNDGFDCLAECRTRPRNVSIYPISTRTIAEELFNEVTALTKAYNKYGYEVYWGEMNIPEKLRIKILANTKFKKEILTISPSLGYRTIPFVDKPENGTCYRGGGIHLNISGLNKWEGYGLIQEIYSSLPNSNSWKSFYRKEFLFRHKTEKNNGFDGIELMSIGFDATKFNGLLESFQTVKHFFHLFDPICMRINEIVKSKV